MTPTLAAVLVGLAFFLAGMIIQSWLYTRYGCPLCQAKAKKTYKDPWGRTIDHCGQLQCGKCDTWVNYDYPDGSKREFCSNHDQ